jgi:hypothetical protein
MSSIIWRGDTYHGISVAGRGVFTNAKYGGRTYAGQCKDGHACGLGVLSYSNGYKVYAEYGPDGQYDGRCLGRFSRGDSQYFLFERGKQKEYADVFADGGCYYNGATCAPDDPRLLALIAQVAPVEVRPPATRRPLAPKPSSDGSAGPFCPRRRWRPPWPPRCTPIPHAVAGGCVTQPNSSKARPRSDACMGFFCRSVHTASCTLPASGARQWPVRAAGCVAIGIVQHAATRGGLHVSVHPPHAAIVPPEPSCQALRFRYFVRYGRSRKPWPACRCVWRCVRTAATKFGGVL